MNSWNTFDSPCYLGEMLLVNFCENISVSLKLIEKNINLKKKAKDLIFFAMLNTHAYFFAT